MVDEPEEVLEETGGEETAEEPQEPEQTPEESVEAEDEAQVDAATEEPEIKSERGQRRVQQLANERNSLREENQTLRQTVMEEPRTASPQEQLPPWMQPNEGFESLAGKELSPEQYEQHLTAKARQIAALEVQQVRREIEFKSNLEQDISHLERTYPELSGNISDPALSRAIAKAQQNFKVAVAANPNVRLRDFIEPLMEVRRGGEQEGRSKASLNLQKQVEDTAPISNAGQAKRESTEAELMRQLETGEISAAEAEKLIEQLQG